MKFVKWVKSGLKLLKLKPSKSELIAKDFKDKFKLSPEEIRKIMLLLEPSMATSTTEVCSESDDSKLSQNNRNIKRIKELITYVDTPAENKYAEEMKEAIAKIHLFQKYTPPVDFNPEVVEEHNLTLDSSAPHIDKLKHMDRNKADKVLRKAI